MLFLTPEQLECQGISLANINAASQIQCSNKLFNRGPKFTQRQRQSAIDFVRKCLQNGIFCFIQDNQSSFVVWTESQELPLTNERASFLKMEEKSQSTSGLSQAAAKSEATRRGGSLNNFSKSELPQNKKQPRRIYRGIAY